MEEIDEEESVVDIDSADKNNPLAVVEYIDNIYAYYKKTEVNYSLLYLEFLIFAHLFSCILLRFLISKWNCMDFLTL